MAQNEKSKGCVGCLALIIIAAIVGFAQHYPLAAGIIGFITVILLVALVPKAIPRWKKEFQERKERENRLASVDNPVWLYGKVGNTSDDHSFLRPYFQKLLADRKTEITEKPCQVRFRQPDGSISTVVRHLTPDEVLKMLEQHPIQSLRLRWKWWLKKIYRRQKLRQSPTWFLAVSNLLRLQGWCTAFVTQTTTSGTRPAS